MRKKLVEKMLAVILAAAMVVPLAACGNDAGEGGSGGQQGDGEETDEENGSPFEKYIKDEVTEDLGGYEFLIIDCDAEQWYPENGEIKSAEDELKVNIIRDVEEKFNCKITVEQEEASTIYDSGKTVIMGGEKYADLIGIKQWGFGPYLAAGLLMDVSTVDSIDLSADYWNQDVVEFMTFGKATYGLGGSFAPDFSTVGVIFYNRRIWEELTLEDGSKLPDPVELVDSGEWTWEKLLEYAKLACRDLDGDGAVSSEADRYGIVGFVAGIFERMFGGMEEDFIVKDADGRMRLGLTSDTAAVKLNFYNDFMNKENVYDLGSEWTHTEKFAEGGALFLCLGNEEMKELREMEDDWGILPVPKWNAAQKEYHGAIDANAPVFCMTNSNQNAHEAGVILSALARRYQALEEMLIEARVNTTWRLEETEYIVNTYIRGHAKYETLHLVKSLNGVYDKPASILDTAARNGGIKDILSELKAYEDPINIALDEFSSSWAK